MEHPSPSGARYFVTFKDDYSGWCSVHFMNPALFLNFVASVKTQTGNNVVVLRSDNGGEYMGKDFRNKLMQLGIRHETSAPYTPAQNGVAERSNRTIFNAARSIIYSSRVPIQLWAEAIAYSVYTLNTVLSSTAEVTPYEAWYKRRPYLRIFGSRIFVHIPESLRKKLDPKSREGIFVGYCESSKAFRAWIPNKQKIVISRDVFIDETNTFFSGTDNSGSESIWFPPYETQPELTLSEPETTSNANIFTQASTELSSPVPSPEQMDTETESSTSLIEETRPCEIASVPDITSVPDVAPDVPATGQDQSRPGPRRSLRVPVPTEKYGEWKESLGLVSLVDPQEPQTYTEALASDESLLWKTAIDDEYSSLITNETWTLQTLPPDRIPIRAKWIFKIKPGSKDTPTRYKARLVAKGYTQKYGLDLDQDTTLLWLSRPLFAPSWPLLQRETSN